MPDSWYSVTSIPITEEVQESRGSREKFWVPRVGEPNLWLLKFPRPRTGEHWAEKIAYEIGRQVGINCARVELARCGDRYATICESFDPNIWYEYWWRFGESPQREVYLSASDATAVDVALSDPAKITAASEILGTMFIPGYTVLGIHVPGYDLSRDAKFSQTQHSVENIIGAIKSSDQRFGSDSSENQSSMLEKIASYAILDGLIGNTDRHHENWMLKLEYRAGESRISAAPSFDHASSLGRELLDDDRRTKMDADGVLNYLQRGRGGVYWTADEKNAPAPINLARSLSRNWPEFTSRTLEALKNVQDTEFRTIVDRVPHELMSVAAKDFAYQVLVTSKAELLREIR